MGNNPDYSSIVKKHSTSASVNYDKIYNELNYIDKNCHLKKYIGLFKPVKNKTWLDVGCNVGLGLDLIKKLGYTCFGFDIVDNAVKEAQSKHPNVIKHSIETTFPYTLNFFDVISATDVLEHLSEKDIDKSLNNIVSVLKPNGIALLASCTHDDKHHVHITIKDTSWWVDKYSKFGLATLKLANPYGIILKNLKHVKSDILH